MTTNVRFSVVAPVWQKRLGSTAVRQEGLVRPGITTVQKFTKAILVLYEPYEFQGVDYLFSAASRYSGTMGNAYIYSEALSLNLLSNLPYSGHIRSSTSLNGWLCFRASSCAASGSSPFRGKLRQLKLLVAHELFFISKDYSGPNSLSGLRCREIDRIQ